VGGDDLKISKPDEPLELSEPLEVVVSDDLAKELEDEYLAEMLSEPEEKPVIKLVDDPDNLVIRLPKGKRQRESIKGSFPLAAVLDAKRRKKWQQVKDRLGVSDDTQVINEILDNIQED